MLNPSFGNSAPLKLFVIMRHGHFVVYDAVCVMFLYRNRPSDHLSVQDSSLTRNFGMLSFQSAMFHAVSIRERHVTRRVEREFSMTRILNLSITSLVPATLAQPLRAYRPALGPSGHPSGKQHEPRLKAGSPNRRDPQMMANQPATIVRCVSSGQAPPGTVAI